MKEQLEQHVKRVKERYELCRGNEQATKYSLIAPLFAILGYDTIDQAVEIANDSIFGLAGNVAGADLEQCRAVARRIRAGWVGINEGFDFHGAFGGYKRSGNGREWGEFGFHEYVEIKSLLGYEPAVEGTPG